jgi:hypothetical protein
LFSPHRNHPGSGSKKERLKKKKGFKIIYTTRKLPTKKQIAMGPRTHTPNLFHDAVAPEDALTVVAAPPPDMTKVVLKLAAVKSCVGAVYVVPVGALKEPVSGVAVGTESVGVGVAGAAVGVGLGVGVAAGGVDVVGVGAVLGVVVVALGLEVTTLGAEDELALLLGAAELGAGAGSVSATEEALCVPGGGAAKTPMFTKEAKNARKIKYDERSILFVQKRKKV